MAYQTILVAIDDGNNAQARVGVAIALARAFNARLVGLYISGDPQITPSVAALLPEEIVDRYLHGTGDRQDAAEQAFREAANAAEWRDIDWRAPAGPPVDAAIAHGRCADLIVLGQPETGEAGSLLASQLVAAILMEAGRPLLVIPHVGAPRTTGSNILVAWDGGREASRAVGDAMPLLSRAERVTVACLDPGASARGADASGRERLVAYLHRHGIASKIVHAGVEPADIPIGDWLLSCAGDLGCDLIVMGGYGHPRWREQILGGATQTLLSSMTVPVLMSH